MTAKLTEAVSKWRADVFGSNEVKGGKIVGQLKDVAYQMRTPDFWNSLDMLGGKSSYEFGGTFNDGKGQPPQSSSVSHGASTARFNGINVINTARNLG